MRTTRLAALALAFLVAACNEGPFIQTKVEASVDKPVDQVTKSGMVPVCYEDDAQFAQAEALARDTCAAYGLDSRLDTNNRYQCRLTTPHLATFRCYHPDMVDARGGYINPFNEQAVAAWRKRTGKPVPHTIYRNPQAPRPSDEALRAPTPEALGAPPPARVTPPPPAPAPVPKDVGPRAPGPADIPAWPQPSAPPVPPPAPLAAPSAAPAPEAFTLPIGTWGEAFERE